jgi:hypothetical protein
MTRLLIDQNEQWEEVEESRFSRLRGGDRQQGHNVPGDREMNIAAETKLQSKDKIIWKFM